MTESRSVLVVALLLASLAASLAVWPADQAAAADLNEALRPCTRTDVIGIWAMIRQGTARSVQVDSTDPSFYPYQRFAFRADASVRHLAAPAPVGRNSSRSAGTVSRSP